jgi:hypothetical protein
MRLRNHQIIGKTGAYEILELIDRKMNLTEPMILDELQSTLSPQETKQLVAELCSIAFVRRVPRYEYLEVTDIGREACLLVKVINGIRLDSVVNQLSKLQSSRYSLITQDICGCFLDFLKNRHDVEDVYICSPWIRLSDDYLLDLEEIVHKAFKPMRFRVITRPPSELNESPKLWRERILSTLQWFRRHNAELLKLRRLHTKLYCAVGKNWQTAFFGSENLTEAENIELGIRVDDEVMTKRLLSYFNRIYTHSDEIFKEELCVSKKS